MDISWATLAPKLSAMALPTTIASVVVGGAFAHFKVWLIKEDDIRARVNLAKKTLTASLASTHRRLLAAYELRIMNAQATNEFADKDVVEIYAAQVLRSAALGAQFEQCEIQNARHYDYFFWSALVAVALTLSSTLSDAMRPFATLAGITLIAWQAWLVDRNRKLAERLRKYEQSL